MEEHLYYVYITTNPKKTVYYVGVTNNLRERLHQHFDNRGNKESFAGKYFCYNLIYFEAHIQINCAIAREKQIKGWTRSKKHSLISSINPLFKFLNEKFINLNQDIEE